MASLDFYINTGGGDFDLDIAGSGLGFYGDSGFGASVPVGTWQGRTFITDGNGVEQGPEGNNVKYLNAGSGILGQASSGIGLTAIPNYQATLNIRFTHSSAVRTQNGELRIYDRSSVTTGAVGVTTKVAELIHPSITQGPGGSGDSTWYTPAGTGIVVPMADAPGTSGFHAGNGSVSVYNDDRHDWYFCVSGSPDSVGSKTSYGLFATLEYL